MELLLTKRFKNTQNKNNIYVELGIIQKIKEVYMAIQFADWKSSSNASPVANKLAEQAEVQQAIQTLQDYKAQQTPNAVAQERMKATTQYQPPEDGKFAPDNRFTSVPTTPSFETKGQAQQRADQEDTRAYQQSHPGLSSDFASKVAEILRQGKQAEQMYRDRADGNVPKKTMGQIAQERMASIPQEQAWRRQNPFTKEMGYEWASDDKLKSLGWGDDDIASMKARSEFDPQEVQNLYQNGALRAPYAEYLKEQERLRQEAEAAAAQAYANQSYDNYSYDYGSDSYSEPAYSNAEEAPIPYYGDNGFNAYDNASMQSSTPTKQKSMLHRPLAEVLPELFSGSYTRQYDVYGM